MKAVSIAVLCTIPAVLGLGGLYWLTFAKDAHSFSRQLGRERRDAFAVHAVPLPERTIKIIGRTTAGLKIESADQDGSRLVAYVRNTGHLCIPYVQLHFKEIAPDGTVIASSSNFQDDVTAGLDAGERIELVADGVPEDNRAVTIQVWATGSPELPCGG